MMSLSTAMEGVTRRWSASEIKEDLYIEEHKRGYNFGLNNSPTFY